MVVSVEKAEISSGMLWTIKSDFIKRILCFDRTKTLDTIMGVTHISALPKEERRCGTGGTRLRCDVSHSFSRFPLPISGATPCGGSRPQDSFSPLCGWLDHADRAPTGFMVALIGVPSEGYGHDGPVVYLGVGQTKPKKYRHKGDAATRCSAVCPHT